MIASGDYIKGFTEIIVCSLLSEGDDYIYNLVKRINACGDGAVRITNPSMLMTMKKLTDEGKVRSCAAAGAKGAMRGTPKFSVAVSSYKTAAVASRMP